MADKNVGFIGIGNMASSIINGLLSKGYIKSDYIHIYDVDSSKYEKFSKYGVTVEKTIKSICNNSEVIFLCIKPQDAMNVLEQITPFIEKDICIVSIMAGVTIEFISENLNLHKNIIRAMPNTPLSVGLGATALVKYANVSDDVFEYVNNIFSLSGKTYVMSQKQLNAVTALSGSGPAYFFKFANAAIKAAVDLGIDESTALSMCAQTMAGSAKMLTESNMSANELLSIVTSKGGTTEQANRVFDENGYEETIIKAINACYEKAVELGNK